MQLDLHDCLNPGLEEQRKFEADLLPVNSRTLAHVLQEFGKQLTRRVSKDVYERLTRGLKHPLCVTLHT